MNPTRRPRHRPRTGLAPRALAIVEAIESRVLLTAGDLDPSFGAGGKVRRSDPGTPALPPSADRAGGNVGHARIHGPGGFSPNPPAD